MYRYNFECEKIIMELVDILMSTDDEEEKVNVLITEKQLLIFKNINVGSILSSRGITEMPDYVLIAEININDINYKIDEDNTIIKYNNNEIILYDFDLNKIKTSLFCDIDKF